jgi:hypothetical protein
VSLEKKKRKIEAVAANARKGTTFLFVIVLRERAVVEVCAAA